MSQVSEKRRWDGNLILFLRAFKYRKDQIVRLDYLDVANTSWFSLIIHYKMSKQSNQSLCELHESDKVKLNNHFNSILCTCKEQ